VARRLRFFGPGLDLIAAAIAVLIVSSLAVAQEPAAYDALVDQYARGDLAGALRELGGWSASAVRNVTTDRPRFLTAQRQRAAVMLHTEMANAWLQAHATADASLHLSVARRALTAMKNGGRGDERTQMFERRWFAFVASMYTSQGILNQAELIVRDGLGLYGHDALLLVARGAIREMDAMLTAANPRGGTTALQISRSFESSAADYRRALDYDDTLATAHLHLGWVRFLGRDDRSGHDFELALEHATDDGTRYLAHLFLGAFAEHKNNLDDARGHYEAALALGPAYQTAYVALSHVEEARGNPARARDLARAYAALAAKEEDPWWNYHLGGFDQPTLDWLRREARSR